MLYTVYQQNKKHKAKLSHLSNFGVENATHFIQMLIVGFGFYNCNTWSEI